MSVCSCNSQSCIDRTNISHNISYHTIAILTTHSMTITTRQQSTKKSNNNLNMITKHPPPSPGLLRPSQDDDTNRSNNYIQQLPLPPTPFNMHHELQSSSQPLINLGTNATNTNTNSSAIIWDYLMAQVKVQLRTMPRDESFFSRGLELQSLVRSEVGICSSQQDLLNSGMDPMTALQSQVAAASLGSRGDHQHQQPLSYAVSSTSFVSISPMRTFKQSRGIMHSTSQQNLLLPSTENGGIGMMKQHVYHHASSAEDTPTTSNKMNRTTTSSHNQDDIPTLYCQCHPSCREVSNPYGTKLYLQDSPSKTDVSSTPLALGKKMSGTCLTNPTIQHQLNFSASKKDTITNTSDTTNTTSTDSPPGRLYLHAAGLSSATATPLHDKFVFSDMMEIDSTFTGISSPSKQKAGSTTKVASKWSEVPFKAKKKKEAKVKSASRTVKKVSSAAKKVDPKPALKKKTNVKSSAAKKKVSPKPKPSRNRTTRGSKKASTLSIDSPTDVDVLCGRGGNSNRHKGNIRFRDYVSQMRGAYQQARKEDKKALSEVSFKCLFRNLYS